MSRVSGMVLCLAGVTRDVYDSLKLRIPSFGFLTPFPSSSEVVSTKTIHYIGVTRYLHPPQRALSRAGGGGALNLGPECC